MWYAITGAIAVILIVILSILIYHFLKEKNNKKKSSRILKFIFFFALLFVLDIPFVINESYKFGKWYHTLWGADDVLAFYGSFLSFIGTVVLGYVAIKQNDKLMHLEEKTFNRECSSAIVMGMTKQLIDTVSLSNESKNSMIHTKEIEVNVSNYGQALLNKIRFDFANGESFESHLILAHGESKNIIIDIPEISKENDLVHVVFTSCYDIQTYGSFKVASGQNKKYIKYYHFYGLNKEETKND